MKAIYPHFLAGCLLFTSSMALSEEKPDGKDLPKPSPAVATVPSVNESKIKEVEKPIKRPNTTEKVSHDESLKKKYESLAKLATDVQAMERAMNVGEINHEFFGTVSYATTTGSVKAADQSKATDVKGTNLGLLLGYGYVWKDHLEPIIELERHGLTHKIAEYSSNESITDVTAGLLVNLPLASDIYAGRKFYYADWVPYVGFAFSNRTSSDKRGIAVNSVVAKKSIISKITLGTRYRLFEHVAINSHIRISYDSSDNFATVDTKVGSTSHGLTVEVQVFGLSILF